jgi:tRNA(fMet)-specific endonuclease VapC
LNTVVLDTNVVSYLMKGGALDEKYRPHLEGKITAISFMTVAELFEGGYRKGWPKSEFDRLRDHLRDYVVIPYSQEIIETYARIRAIRKHQTIAVDDAFIAATALSEGCSLITHNPRDFQNIPGLVIITEV